jgi:UDP-N-acetylmuramoyl-L-alanyl-D-glutamate--2,6-diaminopimelate ligase
MRLHDLLKNVDVRELAGDPETDVSSVVYDSRKAGPGSLFVAVSGERFDGAAFIDDALNAGAAAVVYEEMDGEPVPGVAFVKVGDSREALAEISAAFYGHPSSKLRLIGITGTNGKTTTSYLVKSVIESAGKKAGLLGTVSYMVGGRTLPAPNTTPESADLQAYLADMLDAGARYAVLEVSSHAVVLKRVAACSFKVRVFTNLTQDHLDFHKSMEEYYSAKKIFFTQGCGVCVVNVDDPKGMDIASASCGGVITYGIDNQADVTARNIRLMPGQTEFALVTPVGESAVSSRLVGRHNVYNMLAAAGACLGLEFKPDAIAKGLGAMKGVPGRFERVEAGQRFTLLVDYAHTDDALARASSAAREFTRGRLITVFGCGGDRDRLKRPLMGRTAAELSDLVVVTSDNPRGEDPLGIIAEIEAGIKEQGSKTKDKDYFIRPDRDEAIVFAVGLAGDDDTVLIAGKGHEDYQIVGNQKTHFDDREAAADAVKKRLGGK